MFYNQWETVGCLCFPNGPFSTRNTYKEIEALFFMTRWSLTASKNTFRGSNGIYMVYYVRHKWNAFFVAENKANLEVYWVLWDFE